MKQTGVSEYVRHLSAFLQIGNCVLLQKSTACTDAQLTRAEQKLRGQRS